MTTNGRVDPLGIAPDDISLSWATKAAPRNSKQQAYRIRVGSFEGGGDVWDSGRISSAEQTDIPIPGTAQIGAARRYYWQVQIWDSHGRTSGWSAAAPFETGLSTSNDWAGARWIGAPGERVGPLPLFRGAFEIRKTVSSVRIYASAHGVYRLSINGRTVGDQFLAPGWTDYAQRIQAQTYDVPALLREGRNVIGAALGDGWYRGHVGLHWNKVYGDRLALVAKLHVLYTDGTSETFVTDEQWRVASGPYVEADLQDGERYDARLEQPGWDTPGFDAANWSPAAVVAEDLSRLVPQPDEPVRTTEVLAVCARTEPAPGEFIYDLGQNMVGVVRVRLTGKQGQTVRLRYGEELYRTGEQRGRL